jgi:hypothetical protein
LGYKEKILSATHGKARMPLTDAKIKGLKPRAARYMESDGKGLSLDVLPSGKMSWMFRYRLNGKQERVTLGQYPDLSLKAARDRASLPLRKRSWHVRG